MSIMDQVKQNLREWYSLAADRTSEMTKISVRMYDKYGISREIERQLSELGCHVYHAVEAGQTDFSGDEIFQAAIERIRVLERDLSAKVAEIETIRLQRQQKTTMRQAGSLRQGMPAIAEPDDSPETAAGTDQPIVEAQPRGFESTADDQTGSQSDRAGDSVDPLPPSSSS